MAEKINKTPWIPKRITQHTLFLASDEAPVIDLKPGQQELERTGFYTAERHNPRYTYLQDPGRQSLYHSQISTTTVPDDYKNPQKPMIPAALRVQMGLEKSAAEAEAEAPAAEEAADLGATQETVLDGEAPAAEETPAPAVSSTAPVEKPESGYTAKHWSSTYKASMERDDAAKYEACKQYKRLRGPPFAIMHPPSCVSDERSQSFYQTEFGTYGSNPMDRLLLATYEGAGTTSEENAKYYSGPVASRVVDQKSIQAYDVWRKAGDAMGGAPPITKAASAPYAGVDKQIVIKTDLTKGSTKATGHMPGYMGCVPSNTNNPMTGRIEAGLAPRAPNTGLSDIYHQNIPGYSGHNPVTALNDRGPRQITAMSTFGRDYGSNLGWER